MIAFLSDKVCGHQVHTSDGEKTVILHTYVCGPLTPAVIPDTCYIYHTT